MLLSTETSIRNTRELAQLPTEVFSGALSDLASFWLDKCENFTAPSRSDFDPVEMPPALLPFLILWMVEGGDFRCRLAGTEVCNAAGRELKGLSLAEMHGDGSSEVREDFENVAKGDSYSFVERKMAWAKKDYALYQRLLLPLSVGAGGAQHLVGAFSFPRRTSPTWTEWQFVPPAPPRIK